jgi:hypothetical protein
VRPDLDKTQLLELLRRSARDLPPAGRDLENGFGLLVYVSAFMWLDARPSHTTYTLSVTTARARR